MIYGIDIGTRMGIAWAQQGGRPSASSVMLLNLRPSRFEGPGMRPLKFRKWLEDTVKAGDIVVFEEVRRHLGTDAAHCYGGLLFQLQAHCEERNITYMPIPVGTIKKVATGKGNAKKQAIIDAARDRFGYSGGDDNEADALWILHCGLQNLPKPDPVRIRCPD